MESPEVSQVLLEAGTVDGKPDSEIVKAIDSTQDIDEFGKTQVSALRFDISAQSARESTGKV